jgi:hypothetical protein
MPKLVGDIKQLFIKVLIAPAEYGILHFISLCLV